MRLENELKGERMVTPDIETGPRIVHIDGGSSQQWSEILETGMWTPFAIDAKGGEMKTKGEMQTKGEYAHRGSMSCCHQWQRGRLLMKLSLTPTMTCNGHSFRGDVKALSGSSCVFQSPSFMEYICCLQLQNGCLSCGQMDIDCTLINWRIFFI